MFELRATYSDKFRIADIIKNIDKKIFLFYKQVMTSGAFLDYVTPSLREFLDIIVEVEEDFSFTVMVWVKNPEMLDRRLRKRYENITDRTRQNSLEADAFYIAHQLKYGFEEDLFNAIENLKVREFMNKCLESAKKYMPELIHFYIEILDLDVEDMFEHDDLNEFMYQCLQRVKEKYAA